MSLKLWKLQGQGIQLVMINRVLDGDMGKLQRISGA